MPLLGPQRAEPVLGPCSVTAIPIGILGPCSVTAIPIGILGLLHPVVAEAAMAMISATVVTHEPAAPLDSLPGYERKLLGKE